MENERISGNKTLLSLAEKGKKMQWLLSHRALAFAAPADFVRRSSLQRAKAERVGFEPTIPLRVYKLSRLARSTTLTPLRLNGIPK
jgi:hypothetical protein